MKELRGKLSGEGLSIAIVAARFNEFITKSLVAGAQEELQQYNVDEEMITTVWAPGAFEIPLIAKKLAQSGDYDAVICLGAVIRGSTPHFDFVASQCASGVAQVAMETGVPTIFGVLTTDTIEQAIERAGTKAGNKGADAAKSAVEMANLCKILASSTVPSAACQYPA